MRVTSIVISIAALSLGFIALLVSVRASPSCLTYAEARAQWPTRHLYWHGRGHCWDASPRRRRDVRETEHPKPTAPARPVVHHLSLIPDTGPPLDPNGNIVSADLPAPLDIRSPDEFNELDQQADDLAALKDYGLRLLKQRRQQTLSHVVGLLNAIGLLDAIGLLFGLGLVTGGVFYSRGWSRQLSIPAYR